jgi:molybdate transport system ATP-binding protein
MIEVRLKKKFGAFDLDVEFSSETTGITVLAGPSGSGKSSIINMIAGLVKPDAGRIFINDRLLFDSSTGVDCPIQQRRCGYVFQDGRLFPHMTVQKNLLYGRHSDAAMLQETAELLGIEHLLQRMPGRLSGGEKQRVAIGRALLMQPQILLMDEPLASLDPERKDELLPYISKLPERVNIPIFYVTHSRREILRLSDELIRVSHGRVQSSGKPAGEYAGLGDADTEGEYVSVFECQISDYNEPYGVIRAEIAGITLFILAQECPTGSKIRAAIKAADVSVSLGEPQGISTRNIFRARVVDMEELSNKTVLIHTDAGVPMTARISKASAHRLELKIGSEVYLLVKAVSMTY